jgi:P-type Cu+ transporter
MPKDNVYTCPMHPEIKQNKPGICPKCGMSLESKRHLRCRLFA